MKNAPTSLKLAVVIGFVASYVALFWLFSFRPNHAIIVERIGYLSAVFSALAMLCVCWAVMFALIVLKRNWPVRACRWAGLALLIPCSILLFEGAPNGGFVLLLLMCQATLTSEACRRFAFPQLSDEEALRPEPLPTMFPK